MFLKSVISNSRVALSALYEADEVNAILQQWLSERTGQEYGSFSLEKDLEITSDVDALLQTDLAALVSGKPLQYVVGSAWFHDLKINVSEAVLIPRPETEELVQLIVEDEEIVPTKILDICSGSGCIALALKSKFPDAMVYGAEVSFDALALARSNSDQLQLPVEWLWCDVLENNWGTVAEEQFDLIVSNPPYIMRSESGAMHSNVLQHEPHLALFVEDDDPLVFYRFILAYANSHLRKGGQVWFEINPAQADNLMRLMQVMQFSDIFIHQDLSGKERFVSGKIV